MPKVFIIILNWNGWKDTIDCLTSLESINYPKNDFEIILIDNASTDDSLKNLKNSIPAFKNKITLVENKENLGFSGGNNIGIDYAQKNKADYTLLLNSDTVADPDFLKGLVLAGEGRKSAGIIAPKIYFFDEKKTIWFNGGKFSWVFGSDHIDFGKIDNSETTGGQKKTEFITGCAMLVKSAVFKKAGLLDERFFLYYEDVDFSLRARKSGFECVVVEHSKVWHKIPLESLKNRVSGASKKIGSPSVLYYHYRNAMLLVQKNGPWPMKLIKHFWALWKLAKQGIKIAFFPEKREISKAISWGFFDYYKGKFGKMPK